jgi:hypothetical protein
MQLGFSRTVAFTAKLTGRCQFCDQNEVNSGHGCAGLRIDLRCVVTPSLSQEDVDNE